MAEQPRFEVIDSDGHVIEPDTVWSAVSYTHLTLPTICSV